MNGAFALEGDRRRPRARSLVFLAGAVLLAIGVIGSALAPIAAGAAKEGEPDVAGGGRTIIEGGTGGPAPVPVTTLLAFHANRNSGAFECLALAPPAGSGAPESGQFEINAMYVTGKVTSTKVSGQTATLRGTASVTGLGAGSNVPFTATVRAGGPGTTVVLEISGMTFHEILLEGHISTAAP